MFGTFPVNALHRKQLKMVHCKNEFVNLTKKNCQGKQTMVTKFFYVNMTMKYNNNLFATLTNPVMLF